MPTYAGIADVTSRLGGRPITSGTAPTDTEVLLWLDEAEGELLGTLSSVAVPTSYAPSSRGANIIRGWVAKYVAKLVMFAHGNRDGTATLEDQRALEEEWRLFLRGLRNDAAGTAAMLTEEEAPDAAVGIGSHVTSQTAEERVPIFRVKNYHL